MYQLISRKCRKIFIFNTKYRFTDQSEKNNTVISVIYIYKLIVQISFRILPHIYVCIFLSIHFIWFINIDSINMDAIFSIRNYNE